MKKRILITGSNGMLGLDLCQELRGEYRLCGIDNRRDKAQGSRVKKYFICDITDKKKVRDIIRSVKPDLIVHAAAWTDVDGCELDPEKAFKINAEGTRNVAQAAGECGAALVYISTDFVFDGKKPLPYKEADRPGPISAYGDSKLKGEEAVRKALKEHYILRTSWLYGKHGKNFVDTILANAKEGKPLRVVDDQIGSPTYTKDLAGAIHVLLDAIREQRTEDREQRYGVYHVSNSGSVSWYNYAREILRLAGLPVKVAAISSAELDRPAKRPAMSVLDNSRFKRLTGHRMRNWKSALRDYLCKK